MKKKLYGKSNETQAKERPKRSHYSNYTPLNVPWAMILEEALSTNLLPLPRKKSTPNANGNKHCLYHQNLNHTIEECSMLRDKIEELIRVGHHK